MSKIELSVHVKITVCPQPTVKCNRLFKRVIERRIKYRIFIGIKWCHALGKMTVSIQERIVLANIVLGKRALHLAVYIKIFSNFGKVGLQRRLSSM